MGGSPCGEYRKLGNNDEDCPGCSSGPVKGDVNPDEEGKRSGALGNANFV